METNVHNHKCCEKQKLRRGLWSPDEDEKLKNHMMSNVGPKSSSWSSVPELTGIQRCGKSCRLRWINYLRPDLKRGSFTPSEERRIIDLHRILGNKWSRIASYFPGRTDNEIKNLWNSCLRKRILVGKAGAMTTFSRAHNMPSKYINIIASANDPNIIALGASPSCVNHIINDTNYTLPTTNPICPIANHSLITSNHEVSITHQDSTHNPQQNPNSHVIDSMGPHPMKPFCLVGCDMDQSPCATWHFHDTSSSSSIPSLLDSCPEDVSLHWFDPEEVTSLDQVIGPFHHE